MGHFKAAMSMQLGLAVRILYMIAIEFSKKK